VHFDSQSQLAAGIENLQVRYQIGYKLRDTSHGSWLRQCACRRIQMLLNQMYPSSHQEITEGKHARQEWAGPTRKQQRQARDDHGLKDNKKQTFKDFSDDGYI